VTGENNVIIIPTLNKLFSGTFFLTAESIWFKEMIII
jgi:hypothetical protein